MEFSNNNYIDNAFDEILTPALCSFVHNRFAHRYGTTKAETELEMAIRNSGRVECNTRVGLDAYAVLNVMKDHWHLFKDHFPEYSQKSMQSYVFHLHNLRNRKAHKNSINGLTNDEVTHALDTMVLLLVASGANNEADKIKDVKRSFGQDRSLQVAEQPRRPTHEQVILEYLKEHREGANDDELAEALNINPRQQINQICNRLAIAGHISRTKGPQHKKIVNRIVDIM